MDRPRMKLASASVHRRRLATAGKLGLALIAASLAIGIVGYMALEGLDFVDAFLNAAMILSGMGPLHNPDSTAGKVFAGLYALYSGFAVLAIAAIMFAPIVHRTFHRLHIADSELEEKAEEKMEAKAEAKARTEGRRGRKR
jgi:TRAP-type C4-dicarboxylate transport system permease small subunit